MHHSRGGLQFPDDLLPRRPLVRPVGIVRSGAGDCSSRLPLGGAFPYTPMGAAVNESPRTTRRPARQLGQAAGFPSTG